jgi:hypothetical protein
MVIYGIVLNRAGKPVSDARVYFTASPVAVPDVAQLTAENGTFALSAPVPGTYEITAVAEDIPPSAAQVAVQQNKDAQVEIRLQG